MALSEVVEPVEAGKSGLSKKKPPLLRPLGPQERGFGGEADLTLPCHSLSQNQPGSVRNTHKR